jgi:HJR/Mrr/RecB family endonuclease
MGLHQAFQRTHRIQYWKFKQKCIFCLYLFLVILMIGETFPHGELLGIIFLIGSVWHSYKNLNSNYVLSPSVGDKRSKIRHIAIGEIDEMEGTEFEVFLSKLFDGLGYYAEVTPHNDYGVDVITIKDKIKTGIQAKCYGEGRTIGVEAVNEVCGGAGYWKVHKKMVITNRYFSKKALITAKSNNIEMIDRDGLQLLIKEYQEMMNQRTIFSFFSFLNSQK